MFNFEIFIHLEAVDRNEWKGASEDRPLTDTGCKQSEYVADMFGAQPIDALVSSPALRCRESLEALAKKTGLAVEVAPGFKDTEGYKSPAGWENADRAGRDPLGGAHSAGAAFAAFSNLRERFPDGRVVLCSYGDIVPALIAFISGYYNVNVPPKSNEKGAVFAIQIDGDSVNLETRDAPAGFPR